MAKVNDLINRALDSGSVVAYTELNDNQTLLSLTNGDHYYVGILPSGKLILVRESYDKNAELEAATFESVDDAVEVLFHLCRF